MSLQLADFNFDVPQNLIAQTPLPERAASRLLCYDGSLRDKLFEDLPDLLPKGSALVINNTKVFSCRLIGQLHNREVEVFILAYPQKSFEGYVGPCLVKPQKKFSPSETLVVDGVKVEVERTQDGFLAKLPFQKEKDLSDFFAAHGQVPLPPYIKRDTLKPEDNQRYQTIYAQHTGSVAAPTAGLHFQEEIFEKLKASGIEVLPITLHVGAGTFLPVKTQDISKHKMHKEVYSVPYGTYHALKNKPVFFVGTTALRCMESFFAKAQFDFENAKSFCDQWLSTDLFVYPKSKDDRFKPFVGDGIITNFHQPQSTLFMLICALLGYDEALRIYQHAIDHQYRFYSYGDVNFYKFKKE